MKVAIFNIGKILSGDLASPTAAGDTIVLRGPGDCRLVDRNGNTKTLRASGVLPQLRPGSTPLRFECDSSLGNDVRISMTRK